jgi:hypothetical protein
VQGFRPVMTVVWIKWQQYRWREVGSFEKDSGDRISRVW